MNDHKVTIDWVSRHKYKGLQETVHSWRAMYYGSHMCCRSSNECNSFRNDDLWDSQVLVKGWVAGHETVRDVGAGKYA